MEAQALLIITGMGRSLCYLQLTEQGPLAQERRITFMDRIHKRVCETQMTNHGHLSSVKLSTGQMMQALFRLKHHLFCIFYSIIIIILLLLLL